MIQLHSHLLNLLLYWDRRYLKFYFTSGFLRMQGSKVLPKYHNLDTQWMPAESGRLVGQLRTGI